MFINNTIETAIFSSELNDRDTPVLDLHGCTMDRAKYEIQHFLSSEHAGFKRKDYKVVKIVTGEGSGKLQGLLKNILDEKSLDFVVYYRYQMQPIPNNAVMFVVLAPNSAL